MNATRIQTITCPVWCDGLHEIGGDTEHDSEIHTTTGTSADGTPNTLHAVLFRQDGDEAPTIEVTDRGPFAIRLTVDEAGNLVRDLLTLLGLAGLG